MSLHAPVLIGWEQGPVRRVRVERRACACIDCGAAFEATVKVGKAPLRCPRCRVEHDWNALRPLRLAADRERKRQQRNIPEVRAKKNKAFRNLINRRRAMGLCAECARPSTTYRCVDCRRARHPQPKHVRCVDCGKTIPGARTNRRRCDWCRRLHNNQRHRAAYQRRIAQGAP